MRRNVLRKRASSYLLWCPKVVVWCCAWPLGWLVGEAIAAWRAGQGYESVSRGWW